MEEKRSEHVVNHFEAGSNCQVFNGPVSGCVFAMPGSSVTQAAGAGRAEEAAPDASPLPRVPEVLDGSELWQRVKDAGLVGDDGQPTVSRTEAALLANELAERLGIAHKWKLFERLWRRNNMRGDYNKALEQRKSLAFRERIKAIFG